MALTIKRTHTHNLNGHTAHAASKASRSQAYTLPLVALLSLLSAHRATPDAPTPAVNIAMATTAGVPAAGKAATEAATPPEALVQPAPTATAAPSVVSAGLQ